MAVVVAVAAVAQMTLAEVEVEVVEEEVVEEVVEGLGRLRPHRLRHQTLRRVLRPVRPHFRRLLHQDQGYQAQGQGYH